MITRSCHTRNIHTSADHYDDMVRYGIVLIWIANDRKLEAYKSSITYHDVLGFCTACSTESNATSVLCISKDDLL